MRRRDFITLVGSVGAWLLAPNRAIAQLSDRVRRIAVLSGFAATDPEAQARIAALQQGLKELGWTEGRNLSIEFRWGPGGADQMRAFARELIDLKPDLIVGMTTPAVAALVQETNTIPILFVNIVDSTRPRLRLQHGATWRQRHRIPQFRILDGGKMAGNAEADRPCRQARRAPLQPGDGAIC